MAFILPQAFKIRPLGQSYIEKVKAAGALAIYTPSTVSGTSALDQSGNGYTAQLISTTVEAGQGPDGGPAFSFDGINDYIDASVAGILNAITYNNYTVMAWVRPTSIARNGTFFSFANTGVNFIRVRQVNADAGINFAAGGGGATATVAGAFDTAWRVVFLTANGTNGKFYNNSSTPAVNQSKPSSASNPNNLLFGVLNVSGLTEYHLGYMGPLAIFPTELSAATIAGLLTI